MTRFYSSGEGPQEPTMEIEEADRGETELQQALREQDELRADRDQWKQTSAGFDERLESALKKLDELASHKQTLMKDRDDYYKLYKSFEKDTSRLTRAVTELKAILFGKELTIAQNSGYINRVRELDPKEQERLVEVPATMVNLRSYGRGVMESGSYPISNSWWNIGTDMEEK